HPAWRRDGHSPDGTERRSLRRVGVGDSRRPDRAGDLRLGRCRFASRPWTSARPVMAHPTIGRQDDGMVAAMTTMPVGEQGDEIILDRLAGGDPAALAALYDRYGRLSQWLARQMLGDALAAEDVVQEVFVGIWRNSASYDRSRG